MNRIQNQTRRRFIACSAAAAGTALTGSLCINAAPLPAGWRTIDRPVTEILVSYGAPRSFVTEGKVARIEIAVTRQEEYTRSFERLTALSDRVHVEKNTVTFDRGSMTYSIANRLA